MDANVAYSDVPEGFMVGGTQQPVSYEDVPAGFMVGGQKPANNTGFLGGMWQNLKNAGQSASDLLSGNYEDIGHTVPTPKTEALADKMFPPGYQGGTMETVRNVGNTSPSDWSGALLEKFGDTPEGKALSVIGGVHPFYNAANTVIQQDINPAISKTTGIAPENLQLAELALPAIAGATKIAGGGTLPDDPLTNYAKGKASDFLSNETSGSQNPPSYSPAQIKEAAQSVYGNAEKIGGQLPVGNMRDAIAQMARSKEIGQQTARGQSFAGENPVTQTLAKLQDSVKTDEPWTVADANEIDDSLRGEITKARRAGDYQSARGLTMIKSGLRDTYKTYAEANPDQAAGFNEWIKGDKLYSAASRGEEIQDMIENAQKADVPSTAIKNAFKSFVKNKDNKIGLTDEEWSAADHASKYGVITPILKTIGSRMSGHIAGGLAGFAEGGIGGGALGYMAGNAAVAPFRLGANALQSGRGQNVLDLISQRPEVQEALNPSYKPASEIIPHSSPSGIAAPLIGGTIQQTERPPATGGIGQQNLQELQKLKSTMPQSNAAPQGNASDFFAKEAKAESSNNPNAKNTNSSASGLFQFTDGTWKQMVKRYGADTGIRIEDKNDPKAQEVMAKLFAKDNIGQMQPFLKRMPTKGELYMAHVLGADGAVRLINIANSMPDKQAMLLYPKAVTAANRDLFFQGNRPRTVLEVYQLLNRKVS